jgi:16S rRNA G966 N2-methylase RsmD
MNAATRQFIESHLNDDVRQLALSKFPDDVDKTLALNQIEARQILSKKVLSWASNPDLLFPKHLSLEQCSSELTAKYKASLVENGDVFVDLTGGLGIDSYFLSEKFKTSYYVENQKELCDLAEHNFAVLGRKITVVNSDAETFLNQNLKFDLVYIDPARRDIYNRKMVSLHDCTPDIIDLQNILLKNAKNILIKASPMLDISMIINELPNIAEIHIVAVKNECKEILVLLRPDYNGNPLVISTEAKRSGEILFKFKQNEEQSAIPTFATTIKKYLYEPNAAIMKAGAFKLVSQRFGIDKLHINSHLYTSDTLIPDFPGRIFEVVGSASFSKKIKKELLKDVTEASVAVRNFPLSANELRKSLNLKESDGNFVFGTTMMGEKKVVIYCKKHKE